MPQATCACSSTASVRIALALYGLPRATNLTAGPLQQNVLAPLRALGCVDVFMAVTVTGVGGRKATGELSTVMDSSLGWRSIARFDPCRHEVIDQDAARLEGRLHSHFGPDTWNDEHVSVRNHLMELYSVRSLSLLIRAQERSAGFRYTSAAVARIDTLIPEQIQFQFPSMRPAIVLPIVGTTAVAVNDRFAYGDRDAIVDGHLRRYDALDPSGGQAAVHAEILLCCVLKSLHVHIFVQPIVVRRMSATGAERDGGLKARKAKDAAFLMMQHTLGNARSVSSATLLFLNATQGDRCAESLVPISDACYGYTCAAPRTDEPPIGRGVVAIRNSVRPSQATGVLNIKMSCYSGENIGKGTVKYEFQPYSDGPSTAAEPERRPPSELEQPPRLTQVRLPKPPKPEGSQQQERPSKASKEAWRHRPDRPVAANAEQLGVCQRLVPSPMDTSPIRSPQAVHGLLATYFFAKHLVEVGTRTGDGMACFAQVRPPPPMMMPHWMMTLMMTLMPC